VFVGRSKEFGELDRLLAEARNGRSGVLVLRGEAGVGKTKLLESIVASASEWRVARTLGVESEAELAFAALHQLCSPSLDWLEQLPAPQRDALGAAFGLTAGTGAERFLVGLATLSLLSAAAAEQPLICVIDDAQWLDRESAQALAFVARRLQADPIVMLFATREGRDELAGLPELVVRGLSDENANALLSSVVEAPLDNRVRDRIIAETGGNPLALLELPRGLTPAELAVGFGMPTDLPLSKKIEETFGRRIERLPPQTRRLLVLAAADEVGDPAEVWRAAGILGIGREAAQPLEEVGLLDIDDLVRFRHPLVRSAAYRGASHRERQIVHGALADATDAEADPDRRAWHLAAAATGPDESLAAELERSAGRAFQRSGCIAAATFLERSAQLTPAPETQAFRRLLAAAAYLQAGSVDRARELIRLSVGHLADPGARAQAMRIEGAVRFADGRGGETPTLLFGAALALRELDPRAGNETMMECAEAAMWAGNLSTGTTVVDVAEAVRTWFESEDDASTASLLLHGYCQRMTAGYPAPVAWWRGAAQMAAQDVTGSTRIQLQGMLWNATGDMLDFDNHIRIARERVREARDQGALATLPIALVCLAWNEIQAGCLDAADAMIAEATEIASATGLPEFPGAHGLIRVALQAWRGQDAEAGALAKTVNQEARQQGQGLTLQIMDRMLAILDLGYGRYEEARTHLLAAYDTDPWYVCSMGLADLVEAAWRGGDDETARRALIRLSERAEASQTPWSLGLLARCRALMAVEADANALYLEALDHLDGSGLETELARTRLVYGEWLRRQRRRKDARDQLRAARDAFAAMGAAAFVRRAETELRATGERARARVDQTRSDLTPQELQIAQLAANGDSNAEIAAQLYISPHTVSYHLRKVYEKLGVRSRTQLLAVLSSLGIMPSPRYGATTTP
jgi:DNA-binding CsgD family transcriptional regulator